MRVKLQIYFKATDGKTYRRVIDYANPDASKEVLHNFVSAMYNLTTNDLKNVLKVVNTYLDEESQVIDEGLVTAAEIESILNETYVKVSDDDGITQIEINSILDETYTPVADSDGISKAEIDAILANWD